MNDLTDFLPPIWLRSANIQTALASSKLRNFVSRGFDAQSEKHIFDVGGGLKTSCYVNKHPQAKGMIVLFHGWMGRPQSTYVLSAAKKAATEGGKNIGKYELVDYNLKNALKGLVQPKNYGRAAANYFKLNGKILLLRASKI